MRQLLQLTAHEIRLSLKSRIFWLIATLIVTVLAFFPSLDLLLIQFMIIGVIARDEQSGFTGILASMPYQTVKLYLARALAAFLLLLGLWPFMVLTVGFLPGMEPAEWLLNSQHLPFLTLKYLVICSSAIGFVFLAGLTTRHSWRLYLIIGVGWAIGVFVASNLSYFPSWTAFFVFGSGVMRLMAPSAAIGYFPDQALLPWLTAAHILTAILFLMTAIVYQSVKRKEPVLRLKWLLPLILTWMIVSFFTGAIVCMEINNREKGFRLSLQEAEKPETVAVKTETARSIASKLESYRLFIKLRTAAHFLEGTAIVKLDLADSPESVQFTLRNYFKVKAVTEASNGEKLEWQRSGSLLAVFIPKRHRQKGSLTLEISYSGQVWEWFPLSSSYQNGPVNFIATQFSLMRSGYAWYPVPGIHPLYTRKYYITTWRRSSETLLMAERVSHPPIPFDLTVDLDTDGAAVSNLEYTGAESLTGEYQRRYHFSSLKGRNVFLLVGPYHYEKRTFPAGRKGFIEIYCYRQHQKRITKVLESLTTSYLFYENLLLSNCSTPDTAQSEKICTIVEIPPFSFLTGEGGINKSLTLTDAVLVTEDLFFTGTWPSVTFTDMQANKRDMAVLQRWWPEDITVSGWLQESDISESLMLYLYALYMEKTRGRGFYEQVKDNLLSGKGATYGEFFLPSLTGGEVARDIFMTLDMIRTSNHGDPAIKKIMSRFHQIYVYQGGIQSKDFAKVVEGVVAGMDRQPANSDEIRRKLKSIAKHVDNPETPEVEA
jgi:hypothetical protein